DLVLLATSHQVDGRLRHLADARDELDQRLQVAFGGMIEQSVACDLAIDDGVVATDRHSGSPMTAWTEVIMFSRESDARTTYGAWSGPASWQKSCARSPGGISCGDRRDEP